MSLEKHMEDDKVAFEKIGKSLDTIKDNHLAHIQESVTTLVADVAWLKWVVMVVLVGVLFSIFQSKLGL